MAELIACPNCQRQLQVPENFFGQMVQCPDCQHQFQAGPAASGLQAGTPAPEKPASAPRPKPDDDDSDEAPRRRRPADDDDDDDFRMSRPRHHLTPHRGVLVLIMGILAICCVGAPVTGIIAWILGNNDLKEMDAGRMDPEGRGQTQIGKVLGMISTILTVLAFVAYCLFFVLMIFGAAMAPGRRR
jgi:hypothetical protein